MALLLARLRSYESWTNEFILELYNQVLCRDVNVLPNLVVYSILCPLEEPRPDHLIHVMCWLNFLKDLIIRRFWESPINVFLAKLNLKNLVRNKLKQSWGSENLLLQLILAHLNTLLNKRCPYFLNLDQTVNQRFNIREHVL